MKELTINQEAKIYQFMYKTHVPNYIPNFYMENNLKTDEYAKYLHQNGNNETNSQILESKSDEFEEEAFTSYCSRNLICDICGRSGHESKNCREIPSINDIELSIKSDIDYAEMKIKINSEKKKIEINNQSKIIDDDIANSRIYAEDYFGLYVVDGGESDPIQIDGSLDNDLYCINCGKKGHISSKCNRPDLSIILEHIGKPKDNIPPKTIENRFDRIWNHPKDH